MNVTPSALAKGALRRLASTHLDPTPENYAKAYADECNSLGASASKASAPAWPVLVERLARSLERGGKQWTVARRKEALHRLIDGSRSDADRLAQRLHTLLQAWDTDKTAEQSDLAAAAAPAAPHAGDAGTTLLPSAVAGMVADLCNTMQAGLGRGEPRATELAEHLAAAAAGLARDGPAEPQLAALALSCRDARRWFGQRHELVRQLSALCNELAQGLLDLTEDESWVRGQVEVLRDRLGDINVRSLREAGAVIADVRERQGHVRKERQAAREALKSLLGGMIGEVGALQEQAGGYESAVARHAEAIEAAGNLEGLANVAQAMLADSRDMRSAIAASQQRLHEDQGRAAALESRVVQLEGELRRLADEASTDALTQVANRRGLEQAFARTSAACQRSRSPLSVGLIDIDNFKKLNDRLGHAAGDVALRTLAGAVRDRLRPDDQVARFGGEEFAILLPDTGSEDAQQSLTRLQRSLSASLFMHDGEEVFVTFSAGVTLWCEGETLNNALERADEALYEAKRTGKNRTCRS